MAGLGEGVLLVLAAYGLVSIGFGLLRCLRVGCPPSHRPFVSILLVTRNNQDIIEGLLRSVTGLAYLGGAGAAYEVVVVDHDSSDDTPHILGRVARRSSVLKVIRLRDTGPSGESPFEAGLAACRSRLVLYLDIKGNVNPAALLHGLYYLLGEKRLVSSPGPLRVKAHRN